MADNIRRFVTNLFAFPAGYFEEHSAEELKLTEDERQQLIKMQSECEKRRKALNTDSVNEREDKALKEFESEFFSE